MLFILQTIEDSAQLESALQQAREDIKRLKDTVSRLQREKDGLELKIKELKISLKCTNMKDAKYMQKCEELKQIKSQLEQVEKQLTDATLNAQTPVPNFQEYRKKTDDMIEQNIRMEGKIDDLMKMLSGTTIQPSGRASVPLIGKSKEHVTKLPPINKGK